MARTDEDGVLVGSQHVMQCREPDAPRVLVSIDLAVLSMAIDTRGCM